MHREILKRFWGTDPSKQITSVEKTNFIRCLYRKSDKVTHGTQVEL